MKPMLLILTICVVCMLVISGCAKVEGGEVTETGAPPEPRVVPGADPTLFNVDNPGQFPLVEAMSRPATSELVVTGTVQPDVALNVPVVSLASGRVMAVHARLGDTVKKGQLLFTVRSDDVSGGYSNYRKALADDVLVETQLQRAKDL